MAKSPAALLVDAAGHILRTVQIGSYYWQAVAAKIGDGDNWVNVVQDGANYRLMTEARITDGTDVAQVSATGALHVTQTPVSLAGLTTGKLLGPGDIWNMNVDGSGTPVSFVFNCDPTDDLWLQCLKIIMLPNVLRMDNGPFGSLGGPLTNGCEFSITAGGTKYVLGLLKQTEDIVALPGADTFIEVGLTANDLLLVKLNFGGALKLDGDSSDKIEMKIQDDLTAAGPNSIKYFSVTAMASKG